MPRHRNHYESAFEELLRLLKVHHLRIDESRRTLVKDHSLKSMDFLVTTSQDYHLLIDVKGRQFPGSQGKGSKWTNWVFRDDVESMLQWQSAFGDPFRSAFLFTYQLTRNDCLEELESRFECDEKIYAFYLVWVDEFQTAMQLVSPSWQTFALPRSEYQKFRIPFFSLL